MRSKWACYSVPEQPQDGWLAHPEASAIQGCSALGRKHSLEEAIPAAIPGWDSSRKEINPAFRCYLHHMGRQLGSNKARCRLLVDHPLTDSRAGRGLARAVGRMSWLPSIFHIMGPRDTE